MIHFSNIRTDSSPFYSKGKFNAVCNGAGGQIVVGVM